jgi:hypothetical protein
MTKNSDQIREEPRHRYACVAEQPRGQCAAADLPEELRKDEFAWSN